MSTNGRRFGALPLHAGEHNTVPPAMPTTPVTPATLATQATTIVPAVLLAALTVSLFWPAQHVFFVGDDWVWMLVGRNQMASPAVGSFRLWTAIGTSAWGLQRPGGLSRRAPG